MKNRSYFMMDSRMCKDMAMCMAGCMNMHVSFALSLRMQESG